MVIMSSLLVFAIEANFINIRHNTSFIYLIFILYQFLTVLISFFYMSKFDYGLLSIFNGSSRLFLAPLLVLFCYALVYNHKIIEYLLIFYSLFILIAALTIISQHFFGQFSFLSDPYGAPRHGLIGYSSITGNVTSFSPSAAVASIIIFTSRNKNYFFKSIMIGIILGASILTMGKSGLMNTVILFFFFVYLSTIAKNYLILIYIFLIAILGIYFSETVYFAVISLFVNTTGIEVLGFKLSEAVQFQNFIPRITDRLFGRFVTFEDFFILETLFGIGIKGGGGVFGIANTGTSHNTFIDMFMSGGIFYIIIFITLIVSVQLNLKKFFDNYKDNKSLAFFWSNNILIINMFFLNGAIYQPVISFIFWVSVLYVVKYKKLTY